MCRCAVAISVNDLPAARKASQFASHSSHFHCTTCDAYGLSTCGDTDYENWKPNDVHKLREFALKWRDAATTSEQEVYFEKYGLCWSELWCLSYWDPGKQLVVDSMHCLLEGLLAHHFRELLGLTGGQAGKSAVIPAFIHPFQTPGSDSDEKEAKQILSIQGLLVKADPAFDPDNM